MLENDVDDVQGGLPLPKEDDGNFETCGAGRRAAAGALAALVAFVAAGALAA